MKTHVKAEVEGSAAVVDTGVGRIRRDGVFEYELKHGFFLQWSLFD